ncbi:hypothetical protein [Caldinitratiruptor microaerophilus]|uniref:Periplasmic heavy metal sensor n=1 Tax=Caldinitratiruptor microaerophilus TaxID=671077 RepID=A0AA35CK18_9FIRM|nr:hypothetical protein [Caldinitratiruptor microaerophilus]BDG60720.1 hypothetical protein caldi_18100 [Caldinitratiruptor microaerophilus]
MTRWYKTLAVATGAALALGLLALALPATPAAAATAPAAPSTPAPAWGPGYGPGLGPGTGRAWGGPGYGGRLGGWGHGFGMGPGWVCGGAAGGWALDADALESYVKANPALVAERAQRALENLDAREQALRDAVADLQGEIEGVTDARLKAVLSARLELLKNRLDAMDEQRAYLKALADYARSLAATPQ